MTERALTRPDGRRIVWSELGDPTGRPVFAFHGTPSSRLSFVTLHAAAVEHGVRVIAPDRPGIGASSPMTGFEMLSWPGEVRAVADHLGLERYIVFGHSGGGPYALACGVDPDPRLALVATAGGAGPYDHPGATKGVTASDRAVEIMAARWPTGAKVMLGVMVWSARRTPRLAWRTWESELSRSDREAMRQIPLELRLSPFVVGLAGGLDGTVDDYRILAGDWGFTPEQVSVPAVLWHGAEDTTVPMHHAEDLHARIPGSELFVLEGEGHLLPASCPDVLMSVLADRFDEATLSR